MGIEVCRGSLTRTPFLPPKGARFVSATKGAEPVAVYPVCGQSGSSVGADI